MGTILKAVSKFRGCIDQAKILLAQDPNYKRGFIFGHVWNILKDVEKFTDANPMPGSQQKGSNISHSQTSSTTSVEPSFDINEEVGIKFTERPIGVKKKKKKSTK
uniref:No apical meristem-associated C-terminal domain-containing protein n=1 Tax=Lactuca sativa TaxID=4236 RepID=A0A9R1V413_LACSA|nr:hypothetical protein LSAT_V11C600332580 [Lactuca sativa]